MKFIETRNKKRELPAISHFANGALTFALMTNKRNSLSLSAVFAAIELISNSIAELPILIKRKNENGDKAIDSDHPLNLAFEDGMISKFVLMKNLVRDLYQFGNAYLLIHRSNGIVTSLQYIHSNNVSIDYDEVHLKLSYIYNGVRIAPKNMVHILKNSVDGINGRSIFLYAKRSIDLADITEQTVYNYVENGCSQFGVLSVNGTLTNKQKDDLRNDWRMTYGAGGDNKGGVVVLPGNMTYLTISSNPAEALMLETRLYNLQEICRYFNLNLTMLGDLSHNSYSTLEMTLLQYLSLTLQPIIKLIECEFNKKLLNDDEKGIYSIDLDETYMLKADKASTANYYSTLVNNGLMTINEARYNLGLPAIEGGDDLHMAFSNAESSKISNNSETSNETSDKNSKNESD